MNTHPPDQHGGTRHCLQEFKYAKNKLFVYFGVHGPPLAAPQIKIPQSKSAYSQAKPRCVKSHSGPSVQVLSDLTPTQQENSAMPRFFNSDDYIYACREITSRVKRRITAET